MKIFTAALRLDRAHAGRGKQHHLPPGRKHLNTGVSAVRDEARSAVGNARLRDRAGETNKNNTASGHGHSREQQDEKAGAGCFHYCYNLNILR